jgi:hypothetical protein
VLKTHTSVASLWIESQLELLSVVDPPVNLLSEPPAAGVIVGVSIIDIQGTVLFIVQVAQRVLVLAGELDIMIPSEQEATNLKKLLPFCRTRILKGRSHALLQEEGVDLVQLLKEEGFFEETRRQSGSSVSLLEGRNANGFGRCLTVGHFRGKCTSRVCIRMLILVG